MQTFVTLSCAVLAIGCVKDSPSKHPRPDPSHDPELASSLAVRPVQHHRGEMPTLVDPGSSHSKVVTEAIAILEPTRGNTVRGTVRFRETTGGLDVITAVEGLEPGLHAYHVHLYGDCSAQDATSAGPHFHFHGSSLDKNVAMITGNLGELNATSNGPTTHKATVKASLRGAYSILGRAVVIHEKGNDPTVTPDGGAGARLACGVIGIAEVPTQERPTTAATP